MANSERFVVLQVRIGLCTICNAIGGSQYLTSLRYNQNQSNQSERKIAVGDIVKFNLFLRLNIKQLNLHKQAYFWVLVYTTNQNNQNSFLGKAKIKILRKQNEKLRKYNIKDRQKRLGTIEVSFVLFQSDANSRSIQLCDNSKIKHNASNPSGSKSTKSKNDKESEEIQSFQNSSKVQLNLESNIQKKSFANQYKRKVSDNQKYDYILESFDWKISKERELKITQEVNLKIKKENCLYESNTFQKPQRFNDNSMQKQKSFGQQDAQNLLAKLFQEINQKNEQIRHIKVKQFKYQLDQRRIKRLKKRTQFFIAANELLVENKNILAEEGQKNIWQNNFLKQQLKCISQELNSRIQQLMSEIQIIKGTNKQKEYFIDAILTDKQNLVKQLNILKMVLRQKELTIKSLRNQLSIIDYDQKERQIDQENQSSGEQQKKIDKQNQKIQSTSSKTYLKRLNTFEVVLKQLKQKIDTEKNPEKMKNIVKAMSFHKSDKKQIEEINKKQKFIGKIKDDKANKITTPHLINFFMSFLSDSIPSKNDLQTNQE